MGRFDEAIAAGQKAVSHLGEPGALGTLGHVYAVSGNEAEARKLLARLKDLSKQRYVAPYEIALIYAGLGDKPHALEWLHNAYEDHSQKLMWIKKDPRLDSLRADPRFQETLRRMNLTP